MRKSQNLRKQQIKEKQETLLNKYGLNIQLFAPPTGATRISDVIVPAIFAGYMNKDPLELNAFIQSGVMKRNKEFDTLVAAGGYGFTMPYWDELEGEYDERTDEDTGLPKFNKITAKKEVAVKLFDKYAAGASQLSSELAGSNAVKAIREKFSHKIASLDQKRLFSLLKGVFASSDMAKNVLDITTRTGTAQNIGVGTIIEGQGLLGDRQKAMSAVAVHSLTYTYLKLKNLLTTQKQSEQGEEIPYYANKRVIIDDTIIPDENEVYTTYLFAEGSVAYGRGGELYPVEVGKIPFMEEEGILVRKNHTFHVRGTTWKGSIDEKCTPEDIEKGENWGRAYSNKQIPIVAIRHKVDLTEFTTGTKNVSEEIGKAIALALKGALPQPNTVTAGETAGNVEIEEKVGKAEIEEGAPTVEKKSIGKK
ncbi:MAG: major capsid protein [Cetobacterium sp.]